MHEPLLHHQVRRPLVNHATCRADNPPLFGVAFIRSKSHRVAFVDIIAVSSSSRSVPVASPRNDGRAAAEKEKLAKEKEKQAKEKEEKKKRETLKKEKGKEKKGDKKGKGKGKKEEPPADALTSIMNGFSSFCSSIAGPAPEESKGKKNKK